jgi:hypothetical protein
VTPAHAGGVQSLIARCGGGKAILLKSGLHPPLPWRLAASAAGLGPAGKGVPLGCRSAPTSYEILRTRGQESNVLPRKPAAGAERGSLEPGHAYLLPWAWRAVSLPQASAASPGSRLLVLLGG